MLALSDSYEAGATFSECRKYRYRLWRVWGDPTNRLAVVSLNPSTADEFVDDPTVRRDIGFAKLWGFGALDKLNMFAWRSTDPAGLLVPDDPVGPSNNKYIIETAHAASRVVMAWGSHAKIRALLEPRAREVVAMLRACVGSELGTFGRNANGQPKHPLYLAKTTPFVRE
jgi:hypothetical protein